MQGRLENQIKAEHSIKIMLRELPRVNKTMTSS